MKRKITLLALGAALVAGPVLAAPGGDRNQGGANADRVITRAEAQAHAEQMFARLDVNKDGKLDQADRAARRAAMRDKMFERLDTNKDGSISKAEWDQAAAARDAKRAERQGRRGERAGAAGERRPRHAMRGGHGGWTKGDGAKPVTQAEFVAAALARFDRMDTDKDGKVTPDERRAFRQMMRDRRASSPVPPAGN